MARPILRILTSGIAAWDADATVNFDLITGGPFPLYIATDLSALTSAFPPASYDDCLALVNPADPVEYISNGTTWVPYVTEAGAVADSTATDIAGLATDFNLLLATLRAAGFMAT